MATTEILALPDPAAARDRVMRLLAAGVPLSLLCDLAERGGVDSAAILLDEPAPARATGHALAPAVETA